MKVYLTYENKKVYLFKNWFPKLSDVDKTKPQRKTVSSLHLAITKHDM